MTTIGYDKPVKDFVAELSKTGHVTHESYKKTSVTIHHNGGALTHEGVLNVWKTRAASAHFDVDAHGAVAQYVKWDEYAWAVGDGNGNRTSISIEQANSHGAPHWEVAEVTWQEAARLAGWLFANKIGARPTSTNLFYHKHWSSTDCAGPYMDSVYDKVLLAAQVAYDHFKAPKPTTPPPPKPTPPPVKKSVTQIAYEVIDGKWGDNPQRANRLRMAGYDANAVQGEVNRLMRPTGPAKKTIHQLATEVLEGKWGNNPERAQRLKAAGYDAAAVQREVNSRV